MEILFFISGVLSVAWLHGVFQVRKIQREYTEVLASLQHTSNISSLRYGETNEKLDETNLYIQDVKNTLGKDSYSGINELNLKLEEFETSFRTVTDRNNNFIGITEGEIKRIYGEIENTQAMIRALKEDPNFNNRY
jgi:hypothetical protein|tara:strand:- start:1539 stop:1946 length:408 start_codon:yes stop_codon:yes gene_type:complete